MTFQIRRPGLRLRQETDPAPGSYQQRRQFQFGNSRFLSAAVEMTQPRQQPFQSQPASLIFAVAPEQAPTTFEVL
jgi:hypothetical protein